jgi:excinuclease UvrABC nuclease subunit
LRPFAKAGIPERTSTPPLADGGIFPIRRETMAKKGFSAKNIENLKKGPGVYKLFNPQDSLTYAGKANNLQRRLMQHLNEGDIPGVRKFQVKHTESTKEAERIEKNIIQRFKPIHNEHHK